MPWIVHTIHHIEVNGVLPCGEATYLSELTDTTQQYILYRQSSKLVVALSYYPENESSRIVVPRATFRFFFEENAVS